MERKQLQTSELHGAGAEVRVLDQYGNETDFYIRVVGIDSKVWRNLRRRIEREAFDAIYDDDETKGSQAEYLAEATLGWRGLEDGGEEVVFDKEAAVQLYDAAPYIADQVDRFIADRQNFFTIDSTD